jgi:hypothetical protein
MVGLLSVLCGAAAAAAAGTVTAATTAVAGLDYRTASTVCSASAAGIILLEETYFND